MLQVIKQTTTKTINTLILNYEGPKLKSISTKSSGVDCVDVDEITKRGIVLGNTTKVLNEAVADVAIGLMIAAARRFQESRFKMENNEWVVGGPQWMLGQDITGSTVGIVGLGGIGQAIVKRLQCFDVSRFLYTGHSIKKEGNYLYGIIETNFLFKHFL